MIRILFALIVPWRVLLYE